MTDKLLSIVEECVKEVVNPRQDMEEEQDVAEETPQRIVRRPVQSTPLGGTSRTPILDQMRNWGCHFDGRGSYFFLERVSELQQACQISYDQMLKDFSNYQKVTPYYGSEMKSGA